MKEERREGVKEVRGRGEVRRGVEGGKEGREGEG